MAQGILDAFEAMTLGPGAPGQQDPTMDPAYYPRPAGEDAEAAGQPPPPFQPGNCDPRFMRLTCNAIPSQQASLGSQDTCLTWKGSPKCARAQCQ